VGSGSCCVSGRALARSRNRQVRKDLLTANVNIDHFSKDQLCYKKFVFVAIPWKGGDAAPMRDEKKERWREPCEQIAVEQDLKKLHVLIAELNRAAEEREERGTERPHEA
jgi:hypothetical protein